MAAIRNAVLVMKARNALLAITAIKNPRFLIDGSGILIIRVIES